MKHPTVWLTEVRIIPFLFYIYIQRMVGLLDRNITMVEFVEVNLQNKLLFARDTAFRYIHLLVRRQQYVA